MTGGRRNLWTRSARLIAGSAAALTIAACAVPVAGSAVSQPRAPSGDGRPGAEPGGSEADLRVQAQKYVTAVNERDRTTATAITCGGRDAGALFRVASGDDSTWDIAEVSASSTRGFVSIRVVGGSAEGVPVPFLYRNGRWCISV